MSRSHTRHVVGTLALVPIALIGCDNPPTAPEGAAPGPEPTGDLVLSAPWIDQAVVTPESVYEAPPPSSGAGGPMLSTEEEGIAEIFLEKTVVGFDYDHAYAEGSHYYTGTKGRVETLLNVMFDNMHVASVPAVREETHWLNASVRKFIWAYAQAKVAQTCGLRATGQSQHKASWSFFLLKSTNNFGDAQRSSSADPAYQERCGVHLSNQDPSNTYSHDQGMSCTYRITYDRATLEIVDVELLFCSTTGVLF